MRNSTTRTNQHETNQVDVTVLHRGQNLDRIGWVPRRGLRALEAVLPRPTVQAYAMLQSPR